MKRIITCTCILLILFFWGCETTTSVTTEGKVDTLYINGGDKLTFSLYSLWFDGYRDNVEIELISTSMGDEIPTVHFNSIPAIADCEVDDVMLQYSSKQKYEPGDSLLVQIEYLDDTLNIARKIPQRISSLRCNGKTVMDSASEYMGNDIILEKGSKTLTFTWDKEDDAPYTDVEIKLNYLNLENNYGSFYTDTCVKGKELVMTLPSDFQSLGDNINRVWFSNTSELEPQMGDKPSYTSEHLNIYAKINSPAWIVSLKEEE